MGAAYTVSRRTRLYLVAAILLLVGLGSSFAIYLTAGDEAGNATGYEGAGGYGYPFTPQDSKTYVHDLELYGGKANVLADSFRNWLRGLWHGKNLAFTIAFCTVVLSLGFFLAGRRVQEHVAGVTPFGDTDRND